MIKKRLIPCLLVKEGVLVKSQGFSRFQMIGMPLTAVRFFNAWAVDEIAIIDIRPSKESREKFLEIVEGLSKECFVPLTAGGGVKNIKDIGELLRAGADKVAVNSSAIENPEFISEAAKVFGVQCIVVSIDAKKTDKGYEVYSNGGTKPIGLSPVEWAKKAEQLGAGEIFLNSIDNDGAGNGYDLELVKSVSEAVSIPVIACGGVGEWKHFVEGIEAGASAVSAANIFHFTEHSTKKAKQFLDEAGVDVRI